MCGIVGYLGSLDPKDVIINGLKKLEYRGYDSAGVAILNNGSAKRVRAQGKLKNLEEKLKNEKFDGRLGIGHTRWATHGVPTERNAHPHQVNGISLVHNGIIENYLEIREYLKSKNAVISSDTDSELVAHLIAEEVDKEKDLYKAVQKVLPRLKGAFSILAIWDQQPDQLIAFKDGPPLVVGIGKDDVFVVSDVQATLQYTKQFIYLEDREIVCIHGQKLSFFNSSGQAIDKKSVELKWSADLVEKQGYSHFMLKEIYEQPRAISAAMDQHIDRSSYSILLNRVGFHTPIQKIENLNLQQDWENTQNVLKQVKRIVIVACGTSSYAGQIAKYYFETIARIPTEVDIASEFRYRHPVFTDDTLVLTISQSGETADTLAAIRLAKEAKIKTLSISNVRNSTIDREADGHLYLNCGPEIGVASTKAFTSTITILHCLAVALGRIKGKINQAQEKGYVEALLALPSHIEAVLSYDKYFSQAAHDLKKFKGFLYIGRGVQFPIALEGALKLKELAYYHAEGYAAGEMKHGPLALIDSNMAIVVVAPEDELFEKTMSNLEEAKARGGKIISIGTGDNKKLSQMSERYLHIPQAHWTTNPMIAVVPLQLMAFHLANSLGYDVDQPRNLAKSVTVE